MPACVILNRHSSDNAQFNHKLAFLGGPDKFRSRQGLSSAFDRAANRAESKLLRRKDVLNGQHAAGTLPGPWQSDECACQQRLYASMAAHRPADATAER